MRTKAKGSTDLSDLSLNRWLDDAAIQQGANRVLCQVTVVVVVTGIDVSSTVAMSFARTISGARDALCICVALNKDGLRLRLFPLFASEHMIYLSNCFSFLAPLFPTARKERRKQCRRVGVNSKE